MLRGCILGHACWQQVSAASEVAAPSGGLSLAATAPSIFQYVILNHSPHVRCGPDRLHPWPPNNSLNGMCLYPEFAFKALQGCKELPCNMELQLPSFHGVLIFSSQFPSVLLVLLRQLGDCFTHTTLSVVLLPCFFIARNSYKEIGTLPRS